MCPAHALTPDACGTVRVARAAVVAAARGAVEGAVVLVGKQADGVDVDEWSQMFWCDDCQSRGGAESPWSKGARIREVALTSPLAPVPTKNDDDDDASLTTGKTLATLEAQGLHHPCSLR